MLIDGVHISPDDLDGIALIDISSLCRNIGRICRFAGATKEMCSVLTHSVHCASYAYAYHPNPDLVRYLLMHDLTEAFISDIPHPWKPDSLKCTEERISRFLCDRLLFHPDEDIRETAKEIDRAAIASEALVYGLPGRERFWPKTDVGLTGEVLFWKKILPFSRTMEDEQVWNVVALAIETGDFHEIAAHLA